MSSKNRSTLKSDLATKVPSVTNGVTAANVRSLVTDLIDSAVNPLDDGSTAGILLTSGAPSSGLGVNGNYAIDPLAGFIYGPKTSGAWPSGVSFRGPAGPGVPIGGATGQVLAKLSSTDYSTGWVTGGGGGGGGVDDVPETISIVGGGAVTTARPPGVNDHLVLVNVGAGTGVYTSTITLDVANSPTATTQMRLLFSLPSSTNPIVVIKTATTTIATITNPLGTAGISTLDVHYNGSAWYVTLQSDGLAPTGVTAGTYGSSSAIPIVTIGADGRVTSASTAAVGAAAASRPARLFGRVAIDQGLRIKGGNITPPAESGAGAWSDYFQQWDTFWIPWTKAQVDLAAATGLNTIRLISGIDGILLGKFTRAQFLSKYKQLLDYCLLKGMYVYAANLDWGQIFSTLGSGWAAVDANLNLFRDEVVAFAALLDQYPNVIGYDVSQEGFFNRPGGRTVSQMHTLYASWFTSIRAVSSVPLTVSHPTPNSPTGASGFTDTSSTTAAIAYMDYLDFHVYYSAVLGDLSTLITDAAGKQIIFGEIGASPNILDSGALAMFNAQATLINTAPIVGACVWAIADISHQVDNSGRFGLYDYDTFSPRTSFINVVKTWLAVAPAGVSGSSFPSQTGQSGKFLTTDGSNTSWADPAVSSTTISSSVTYYGSSAGNDGNNGLSSGAPKTLQGLVNMVSGKTIAAGVTVTMQLADGTYTLSGTISYPLFYGSGVAVLQGNTSNKSSVVLSNSAPDNNLVNGGNWSFRYLSCTTAASGRCFVVAAGGLVIGKQLRIASGANYAYHFYLASKTSLSYAADCDVYFVESSAFCHINGTGTGTVVGLGSSSGVTINCGGNVVSWGFGSFIALRNLAGGEFIMPSNHIAVTNGSMTGTRAIATGNAVYTFFGSAGTDQEIFFAQVGSSASTQSTGGQYVAST